MPSPYIRKLAESFRAELERLKSGTAPERQRYFNALSAMNKVMANPLHHDFKKDLPQNFKAADVLQQYRLFFRIIPAGESGSLGSEVVYFVWINDADSIHRTGKPDDCYQVFCDKLKRGEIEPYAPNKPLASREQFIQHDQWGAPVVYVSFLRRRGADEERADSYLLLNRVMDKSYRIERITVSMEDAGLASRLLKGLCESADRSGIELSHELDQSDKRFGKTRHVLEKFKFVRDDVIETTEIWIRQPSSAKS